MHLPLEALVMLVGILALTTIPRERWGFRLLVGLIGRAPLPLLRLQA